MPAPQTLDADHLVQVQSERRCSKSPLAVTPGFHFSVSAWRSLLELYVAVFPPSDLLKGLHVPAHLREFGASLVVTTDEECGRPKHHHRNSSCYSVVPPFCILNASELGGAMTHRFRFLRDLLAIPCFILVGRDIGWRDLVRTRCAAPKRECGCRGAEPTVSHYMPPRPDSEHPYFRN
jgi:hypothetical protein